MRIEIQITKDPVEILNFKGLLKIAGEKAHRVWYENEERINPLDSVPVGLFDSDGSRVGTIRVRRKA